MSGQTLWAKADILKVATYSYAGKAKEFTPLYSICFPTGENRWSWLSSGAEWGRAGTERKGRDPILSHSLLPMRAPIGILAQRQAVLSENHV